MRLLASSARWRVALAAASLAALCAGARASEPAQIQYLYTVFLDVPAAFERTLAECRKVDPDSVPALKADFAAWQKTHALWQPRMRSLVLGQLKQRGTPEQVDRMVAELKSAAGRDGPLAAANFPAVAVRPFDCEHTLREHLSGRDLMINVRDYVQQWSVEQLPPDGRY